MLDTFLIAAYIVVVVVVGLLVFQGYARFKVRRSWRQHSAFYGETELTAPRFRPFFRTAVCRDPRGESALFAVQSLVHSPALKMESGSADRARKNRQRVEEELLKAVRRGEGSV